MWLLAMVVAGVVTAAGSDSNWESTCTASCKCVWSEGKKTAECINGGFTSVPKNLSADIQILKLNYNNFRVLEGNAFKNVRLVNIHKLFMKNCSLMQVDFEAFTGMKVLIELDLSNNHIEFLHPKLFRGCEKIREIRIQHNPIKSLDEGLFSNLHFLQIVDLSFCQLKKIHLRTFSNVSTLRTLEFKGNQLTSLDLGVVDHLPKLSNLGLTHNPWDCDCHLRPLRNFVMDRSLYAQPTTCQSSGKEWKFVPEEEFACKPEVEKLFQDGNYLHCFVMGDPVPIVKWFFNGKPVSNHSYTGAQYVLQHAGGWCNLTVRNAGHRDNGEYKCEGRNYGGEAAKTLEVSFRPDDEMDTAYGVTVGVSDAMPLIIGVVVGALLLLLIIAVIVGCCVCKKQRRVVAKKDHNGMTVEGEEKTLMNSVNPVQKPPRKMETTFDTSEAELLDSVSLPYNDNGSVMGSTFNDSLSTPVGTLGRLPPRDASDPPDLLAFPGKSKPFGTLGSPGSRPSPVSQFGTLPFSRSQSPFSPPLPVVARGTGYVTIPRRPRVPSYRSSLSPVLNSPDEPYCEPVYDNLGKRTSVRGNSEQDINLIGSIPASYKNRPLPLAPYEADNRLSWARSTPDAGDERERLITSSPAAVFAPAKKVPPNPPPKPRKKSMFQDEGEDGTEV